MKWLERRGSKRIGIHGSSYGAATALLSTATIVDVKAVVADPEAADVDELRGVVAGVTVGAVHHRVDQQDQQRHQRETVEESAVLQVAGGAKHQAAEAPPQRSRSPHGRSEGSRHTEEGGGHGLRRRRMTGHVGREPSCAICHIQGIRDFASPDQIRLFDSEDQFKAAHAEVKDMLENPVIHQPVAKAG
mgnify:CR=1 FL=1